MKTSSQFQRGALALLLWLAAGLAARALAAPATASYYTTRHRLGQLRGGRVRQRQLTRYQQICRLSRRRPDGGRRQRGGL